MRPNISRKLLLMVSLLLPSYSGASTVLETTGWIIDEGGQSYEFEATIAPFTYKATVTDVSIAPSFGLTDIFLSISTTTSVLDSRFGEGSIVFPVTQNSTYFANVFARGAGFQEAGQFELRIETVPIPASIFLFGSGLVAMVGLRRKLTK